MLCTSIFRLYRPAKCQCATQVFAGVVSAFYVTAVRRHTSLSRQIEKFVPLYPMMLERGLEPRTRSKMTAVSEVLQLC